MKSTKCAQCIVTLVIDRFDSCRGLTGKVFSFMLQGIASTGLACHPLISYSMLRSSDILTCGQTDRDENVSLYFNAYMYGENFLLVNVSLTTRDVNKRASVRLPSRHSAGRNT